MNRKNFAASFAAATLVSTVRADAQDLSGDDMFARAAAAENLTSYSVPVHFAVHMRRPIGVRAPVEGIIYYKAPGQTALVLTKVPGPIGGFFKGSYRLDMTAQTWPGQYKVTSVGPGSEGSTYVLGAVPKVADPGVQSVQITVAQVDYEPLAIRWAYRDGSSIDLKMQNRRLSGAALPQTETIVVTMPKYALDATATYGDYALNVAVPDDVFRKT
ncbi:MAG: hypothetical protein JO359_02565 [Candidatus Eremiobacteraeota bacterium]|nr:hypothetical protein [Candidatus Eremiobacteraeota bacterium]